MPNNIAHFDIEASDIDRARRFYQQVFGWRFEAWGPPDFFMIHTGSTEDPGIHGSMSKRHEPVTGRGRTGYECTVSVDDIGAIKSAVIASGGKILLDEYEIGGVGKMIRFEDSEGNIVCAMRYVQA